MPIDEAPPVTLAAGQEARLQGRFDDAIAIFEAILAREPENLGARLGRAAALSQARRLDQAAEAIRAIHADLPEHPIVNFEAGFIARAQGRDEDELRHFEVAAARAESPTMALLQVAETAHRLGRLPRALEAAHTATELSPDSVAAWLAYANAARTMGDEGTARDAMRRAALADPTNPTRLMELAHAALQAGNGPEALRLLGEVEALPSRPPLIDVMRGHALLTVGDQAEALASFRRAVEANPQALGAATGLIHCLLCIRDYAAVEMTIAEARERFGRPAELVAQWAALLRAQGRLAEARDALRSVCEESPPGGFALWKSWSELELQIGDGETRAACLAAAHPVSPAEHAAVACAAGQVAEAAFDWKAAREAYRQALEHAPEDGVALDGLARIAALHMNHAEAQQWLRRQAAAEAELRVREQRSRNPSQTTTGQIALEFRLDRAGDRALGSILPLPPEDRIPLLMAAARELPDSTAVALWLLMSFRQAGRLGRSVPSADLPPIPQRLLWLRSRDASVGAARLERWRALNPGLDVCEMDRAAAIDYLKARHGELGRRAWLRTPEAGVRADLVRLAWLADGGGWSVAPGAVPGEPLAGLGVAAADFAAVQGEWGAPGTKLLGAAAGSAVAARALDLLMAAIGRGDMEHPWLRSGPGLLARAIASIACNAWRGIDPLCTLCVQRVNEAIPLADSGTDSSTDI